MSDTDGGEAGTAPPDAAQASIEDVRPAFEGLAQADPAGAAAALAPSAEAAPVPSAARLRLVLLPFWNGEERRLRALWRVAGQTLILVLLGRAVRPLVASLGPRGQRGAFATAAGALLGALVILAAVALAARLLDRRPLGDFGLRLGRPWMADFGFGLFLGALLMSLAFAGEWGAGWVTVTRALVEDPPGLPFAVAFLAPLGLFVAVGFYEELLFRGYPLRELAEGLSTRRFGSKPGLVVAVVLTSSLFGLGHATNPNATLISSVNIAAAGVFLSLGYVLTGRLGLPIGLHISWNLFQGPVYGFPVSGVDVPGASVLVLEQGGPAAWTGGPFGPEGGLVGLLLMLLGSALIVIWVRRREGRATWCVALAEPPARRAA